MNRPIEFRIGLNKYKVSFENEIVNKKDKNRIFYGRVLYHKRKILISKQFGRIVEKQSLLHELIHAMLNESGYKHEHDESVVDAISVRFLEAMKQNPNVFKWLMENL